LFLNAGNVEYRTIAKLPNQWSSFNRSRSESCLSGSERTNLNGPAV